MFLPFEKRKMLTNEELKALELEVTTVYENGGNATQRENLNCFSTDTKYIPFLQQIVDNPDSLKVMSHFALISLRSLFEIDFSKWDSDKFSQYQDWLLNNLYNNAESLDASNIDAYCKLFGTIFACGFQIFSEFQLRIEILNDFLKSEKSCHNEIGLYLCSNVLYSIQKNQERLTNDQMQYFKMSTMLTCYSIGNNIFENSAYFSDLDVVKSALILLIDCLTFDIDISKKSSMVFLPRTEKWQEILSNTTNLLSTISEFYFHNENSKEIQSKVLELIYYLTSVRLGYSEHIEYLNCVIKIIIQILETNPAFEDPDNVGQINMIILKIKLSIVSDDASKIPIFEDFISHVYNYTLQFFDLDTFESNISDIIYLLDFWSKISISYPQKVDELAKISQNLYEILINAADMNINFISKFDHSYFFYISSFVYKIGLNNDREFFKAIFSYFVQFQNELYQLYNQYISEEGENDYRAALSSLELKVSYLAMIISAPVIRIMNARDDILVGYSMSNLINFFISSNEKITKVSPAIEDWPYNFVLESVVIFLISQLEKGSNAYLEKSFTSLAIEESPIKTIEMLHSFFLSRLLSIIKIYPSQSPIISYAFESILGFYSLRLDDITNTYLVDTFLDDFLYNKMRLKPNVKTNIYQMKVWNNQDRIKFNQIFSILLSKSASYKSDFTMRKTNFLFYLRDLKKRIAEMNTDLLADNYMCDLYGLFKSAENSEAYSLLENYFFNSIPLFGRFKVNYHLALKFFAEFTENRFNRISSLINKKDGILGNQLNELLIFKEAGSYLIEYYRNFQKEPEKFSNELKYAFRILSNIFNYYSSCIGAMKLYGDDIYKLLFKLFIENFCYVTLNIKTIINYDYPSNQDIRLIFLILKFLAIMGNKNLFVDIFNENNLIFTSIFIFTFQIIVNKSFLNPDILQEMFEVIKLISFFILNNKDNTIGNELLVNQDSNKLLLTLILENLLNILIKLPHALNNDAIEMTYNIFNLFPSEEFAKKLLEILENLIQRIYKENLIISLQSVIDYLKPHDNEEEKEV